MIKETEPLLPTSPSPKLKDWSVTQPRTRMPRTHTTQFSMPRDWSVENSMILLSNQTWNIGHSKLSKAPMENPWLLSSTRARTRNSTQKKSPQWFWPKWNKSPKHTLAKKSKMQLSQFQPISMILRDKPPKTQVSSQAWTYWESSTNQLPQPSLTDLIRKIKAKETSLFSTSEEEHSMFRCYALTMVSSKSRPLPVILIWEVKTLITSWSNTVSANFTRKRKLTSRIMPEPWGDWEPNAKKPRESWAQPLKLPLKLIHLLNQRTFH